MIFSTSIVWGSSKYKCEISEEECGEIDGESRTLKWDDGCCFPKCK